MFIQHFFVSYWGGEWEAEVVLKEDDVGIVGTLRGQVVLLRAWVVAEIGGVLPSYLSFTARALNPGTIVVEGGVLPGTTITEGDRQINQFSRPLAKELKIVAQEDTAYLVILHRRIVSPGHSVEQSAAGLIVPPLPEGAPAEARAVRARGPSLVPTTPTPTVEPVETPASINIRWRNPL